LANFNLLCLKADARDRLGMICQYSARIIIGLLGHAAPVSGTRLARVEELCRLIWANLSSARRTQRWCKELPVLQSIPQTLALEDPVDRALELIQKVSLAAFYIIDHIGGLKQWKVLPGGKRAGMGTIIVGLKVLLVYCAAAVAAQAKKLCSKCATREDRAKCAEATLKAVLLGIVCAHLSSVREMHDVVCGIAGVGYGSLELKGHWTSIVPAPVPPKAPKVVDAAIGDTPDEQVQKPKVR